MAGEVIVDALPYIDQGYDEPGVRDAVSYIFFGFRLCLFNNFDVLFSITKILKTRLTVTTLKSTQFLIVLEK